MKKAIKDYLLITRRMLVEGISFNEDVAGDNYYHVHREVAENEKLQFDGPVHFHHDIKKGARIKAPNGCVIIEKNVEDEVRIRAKYRIPAKGNSLPVEELTLEHKCGIEINGKVGHKVRLKSLAPITIKKEIGNKLYIHTDKEFTHNALIGNHARIRASIVTINYIGDYAIIKSPQGANIDECGKYCTLNARNFVKARKIGRDSTINCYSRFNQSTIDIKEVGKRSTIECNGNIFLEGELSKSDIDSTSFIKAVNVGPKTKLVAQEEIFVKSIHPSAELSPLPSSSRMNNKPYPGRGGR